MIRSTISALIVAAGLGLAASSVQAAPVASGLGRGVADAPIVNVQYGERRMMRHRMERRMMRHRAMRRGMMRRGY